MTPNRPVVLCIMDGWGSSANSALNAVDRAHTPVIDELIAKRARARATRDFDAADAARDALGDMGVSIEDTPDGTIWRLAPTRGTR